MGNRLPDILLRCHVWFVATAVVPMAKFLPLKRVLRLLSPPRWFRPYRGIPAGMIRRVVDRRLARPVVMTYRPCLRKGLVLFHMLQLAGLPARLHFGLYPRSREGEAFRGHCWVTVDGEFVGEAPDESLTAVWTHPGVRG